MLTGDPLSRVCGRCSSCENAPAWTCEASGSARLPSGRKRERGPATSSARSSARRRPRDRPGRSEPRIRSGRSSCPTRYRTAPGRRRRCQPERARRASQRESDSGASTGDGSTGGRRRRAWPQESARRQRTEQGRRQFAPEDLEVRGLSKPGPNPGAEDRPCGSRLPRRGTIRHIS